MAAAAIVPTHLLLSVVGFILCMGLIRAEGNHLCEITNKF